MRSGNVSHVGAPAFNDHFDHNVVVFENMRDAVMLEVCAFDVAKSKSPQKKVVLCLGHCCGPPAHGSNTSMLVSQRLNAGIPSIRRPASDEIISASALPCETAVCFLHDHEIGPHVWFPNMQNTPPDVDLESVKSPANSAS